MITIFYIYIYCTEAFIYLFFKFWPCLQKWLKWLFCWSGYIALAFVSKYIKSTLKILNFQLFLGVGARKSYIYIDTNWGFKSILNLTSAFLYIQYLIYKKLTSKLLNLHNLFQVFKLKSSQTLQFISWPWTFTLQPFQWEPSANESAASAPGPFQRLLQDTHWSSLSARMTSPSFWRSWNWPNKI